MKICKQCLREFEDRIPVDFSPIQELGELFLDDVATEEGKELCPDCREEMGVLNLLGFGE